jgi:hypothetical protein
VPGTNTDSVQVTNHGCTMPTSGVYLAHFAQIANGGNCGAVSDQLLDVSKIQTPQCTSGTVDDEPAASGCAVTVDAKGCAIAGGTESLTEKITWNGDYSQATGTAQVSASSNGTSCSEVYDVTLTKQ